MSLIALLQILGRTFGALFQFYDLIVSAYRENQKSGVSLELKNIQLKKDSGTLTDDDIRAANKRLRDKTANLLSKWKLHGSH